MLGMLARHQVTGASPYWNPKTETLAREQLESLQLAKLSRQVGWAAERSCYGPPP